MRVCVFYWGEHVAITPRQCPRNLGARLGGSVPCRLLLKAKGLRQLSSMAREWREVSELLSPAPGDGKRRETLPQLFTRPVRPGSGK